VVTVCISAMLRCGIIPGERDNLVLGTVKFFNSENCFGFISPDAGEKDVFVHVSTLQAAGIGTLGEGERVTFDVQADDAAGRP
jgi:CspA family cold shock protein